MSCNSLFNLQHRVVSQSFNVRGFKLSCFAFFCISVIVNKYHTNDKADNVLVCLLHPDFLNSSPF